MNETSHMTDLFVAFYRSMNLGHAGSPDRATLQDALNDAGAHDARSFQTNGTVVFASSSSEARKVVDRAAAALKKACGYDDAVFVRPLDSLATLLRRDPFKGARDERTYRETLTFFDSDARFDAPLPWTNPRGDVDLLEVADGVAVGIIRKERGTAGSPTAEIEKRLDTAATTRTLGTVERLVQASA